jgi:DNA-binding transcriptional LysR family regulator
MEIKWIEDFVALSQHQSFSRAAEIRNVTQSGFSRRIQALEQWVGADLVDRSGYPPTLTDAGRLFKEVAEDVLAKLYDTRAVIRNERRMPGIGLQIVAGHAIALAFLPGWLASLPRDFRDVRTRVIPTNVHDSILALANGNCDLMLAYHHPQLPLHLDATKYEHLTVGIDTLVPVCKARDDGAPAYRLAGSGERALPLLSYADSSYFGRCFALLVQRARSRPNLQRHYESDMAELLKKMALAGEGIAWLPRSSVAAEISRGDLVVAGGASWSLELELRVYRDATARNPLVAALWQHLAAAARATPD